MGYERRARREAVDPPRLVVAVERPGVSAVEHAVGLAAVGPLGAATVSRLFAFDASCAGALRGTDVFSRDLGRRRTKVFVVLRPFGEAATARFDAPDDDDFARSVVTAFD